MIDTLTLLFTSGMVLFVLIRAAQLDRKLTWFAPAEMVKPRSRYNWRRTYDPASPDEAQKPTP